MPEPTFSVVIPTHNGRQSVQRAVESVLAQTFPDFELIVVSDGDAQRTRQLLQGVTDPRLRIVEQPKKGVSAARNLGAASGRAPWITFLDDDDTARPHWLEWWVDHAADGIEIMTASLAFWSEGSMTHIVRCRHDPSDLSLRASSLLPAGFAIRRTAFNSVEGYDEALAYAENLDFGLRLLDRPGGLADSQILTTDEIVADFIREAAKTRVRRYESAPADASRVFLERYAHRFEHDRAGKSSYLRLISRDHRFKHQPLAAIRTAAAACQANPRSLHNYRSLLLALSNLPVSLVSRLAGR